MHRTLDPAATAKPDSEDAPAGLPAARLAQLTEPRASTQEHRFWRRLRRERKAFAGLIIILLLVVVTVLGPTLAPYDPEADEFAIMEPPSLAHPMGTDSFGRDLFSRLIVGTRVSFTVGIAAAAAALVIGGGLGLIAGFYGRWVDSLISRLIDLLWAFPVIVLAIGLVAIFGAGFRNVVIAIAIAYVDDFARIVRGEALQLRESDFTLAARAVGAQDWRIMISHILPNMVAPVAVLTTFAVGLGILSESTLTFLGLGISRNTPTWGLTLDEGLRLIRQAWWISVFPGLAIVCTVMAMNLFGDGLRDALDVKGIGDA